MRHTGRRRGNWLISRDLHQHRVETDWQPEPSSNHFLFLPSFFPPQPSASSGFAALWWLLLTSFTPSLQPPSIHTHFPPAHPSTLLPLFHREEETSIQATQHHILGEERGRKEAEEGGTTLWWNGEDDEVEWEKKERCDILCWHSFISKCCQNVGLLHNLQQQCFLTPFTFILLHFFTCKTFVETWLYVLCVSLRTNTLWWP